ncbi:MAG: hypothetical protein MUE48_12885 [Desulfobacterales bacterium]|nr:hypothetical protein [Desulfobacterales bacterium]
MPAVGGEAGQEAAHRVFADAAGGEQARARVGGRVVPAFGEALGHEVHAGRPVEVSRRRQEGAAARPVVVLEHAAELSAQRGRLAGLQGQLGRDAIDALASQLVDGLDPRRPRPRTTVKAD